jgi:hypothetical protein
MAALAIDIGRVLVAQTDLQRAADAAAHAAALEYRSDDNAHLKAIRARHVASQYVEDNPIIDSSATVSTNYFNEDRHGDIVLGRIDFDHPSQPMTFGDYAGYNAVRVRVRRTASRNGAISMAFARVLGHSGIELEAEATAAVIHNIGGFKIPQTGENVPLLPITIRDEFWADRMRDGIDEWAFDSTTQAISRSPDDVPEVVIFPNATESSGNVGTVNIGVDSNSTSFLGRQIRTGISPSDLDLHGGKLALDDSGELPLTGDPGLSAGIKNDLEAVAGRAVIIPLYRQVSGTGNTAVFTIVKFVGARIMAVNLTSGEKFVSVQPKNITSKGTIQAAPGLTDTSDMIYSPPVIVQ